MPICIAAAAFVVSIICVPFLFMAGLVAPLALVVTSLFIPFPFVATKIASFYAAIMLVPAKIAFLFGALTHFAAKIATPFVALNQHVTGILSLGMNVVARVEQVITAPAEQEENHAPEVAQLLDEEDHLYYE